MVLVQVLMLASGYEYRHFSHGCPTWTWIREHSIFHHPGQRPPAPLPEDSTHHFHYFLLNSFLINIRKRIRESFYLFGNLRSVLLRIRCYC